MGATILRLVTLAGVFLTLGAAPAAGIPAFPGAAGFGAETRLANASQRKDTQP